MNKSIEYLADVFHSHFGLFLTIISKKDGTEKSYAQRNMSESAIFQEWWDVIPAETKSKIMSKQGIYTLKIKKLTKLKK